MAALPLAHALRSRALVRNRPQVLMIGSISAGSACQQQDPPPAGDGCDEAAEWIKNRIDPSRVKPVPPDPDYRHPRSFRLSEMPRQCQAVATAR